LHYINYHESHIIHLNVPRLQ